MKALTKSSSNTEIKQYFSEVFNLSKSDQEFPVNLDEVWPLVYERKDSAVDALRRVLYNLLIISFSAEIRKKEGRLILTFSLFLALNSL